MLHQPTSVLGISCKNRHGPFSSANLQNKKEKLASCLKLSEQLVHNKLYFIFGFCSFMIVCKKYMVNIHHTFFTMRPLSALLNS